MGLGLYLVIVYGLAFALLAIAVLWCVPKLRVTGVNVLLFILGAVPGMLVITKAVFWVLVKSFGIATVNKFVGYSWMVANGVFLFGAIASGTILVWLKTLAMKAFQSRDNS